MNEQTEPTEAEIKSAKSKQAQIQADTFRKSLRFMNNAELDAAMRDAEAEGDARKIKSIKATIDAKEASDRAKIIRTSERCIEACRRSGTPQQLAEEEARLASYKAGGPLPVT